MCYFSLDKVAHQPLVELSDSILEKLERSVWPRTRELWLSFATEPLIGRKLESVLARAHQAGIPSINMYSNGLGLTEKKAELLIDKQMHRYCLSIDGASRETYERIRQGSNFEVVLANTRRLQSLKRNLGVRRPLLYIDVVLMLENMHEWTDLVHLAADLGADKVRLRPQTYYAEFNPQKKLTDYRDEYNEALQKARRAAVERHIPIYAPHNFKANGQNHDRHERACAHCHMPWMNLMIYPNGEVTPCSPMFSNQHFGNLENQAFEEIFFGPAFSRLRQELRSGRFNAICEACPAGHLMDINDQSAFIPRHIFPNS